MREKDVKLHLQQCLYTCDISIMDKFALCYTSTHDMMDLLSKIIN